MHGLGGLKCGLVTAARHVARAVCDLDGGAGALGRAGNRLGDILGRLLGLADDLNLPFSAAGDLAYRPSYLAAGAPGLIGAGSDLGRG